MLEKVYRNLSEKNVKYALIMYHGLLITSIVLPVLFLPVSYFLNGKIYSSYPIIIFVIIFIWSLFNIEYLKKKMRTT
jgi:hypothetical protein